MNTTHSIVHCQSRRPAAQAWRPLVALVIVAVLLWAVSQVPLALFLFRAESLVRPATLAFK